MDDFASLQSSVTKALVATTKTVSQLSSQDLTYHRALSSRVATSLDRQNERLLSLTERLLASVTAGGGTIVPPKLHDVEAIDDEWKSVVEVIDGLLERADTALDEFTGAVKRLTPDADSAKASNYQSRRNASAFRNQDLDKPQLLFDHVPTNKEIGPFKPLLTTKPHATVPYSSEEPDYAHPYQAEIDAYEYPNALYQHAEPIPSRPFESTTAIIVDTEEKVQEMLKELKQAREIAIDLEHHDQRSYIGIVSLMQISTRDQDWIVDTLKPWRRNLQCLNEVFADPSIVKVLHGAHMDAIWLQRDLGLYLVGLFDTHHASRSLGYPGGSLAYLLKRFVNFDAQKQYQTADWRIRPLPQELLDYARSDTHYLLYIFDCMRNELIERSDFTTPNHEKDKLWDVLLRSSETALQVYEHPAYDGEFGQGATGWYKMLAKTSTTFSKVQFAVFRALHKWRDEVAREQDDSTHYVMPNHQIFSIAKALPTTKVELLGLAQPTTRTVRLRIDELLGVIAKAQAGGENGPEMMDILNQIEPQYNKRISKQHFISQQIANMSARPTPVVTTSTLPLRAASSTFWGSAFEPSSQGVAIVKQPSISFSLPVPPAGVNAFQDPDPAQDVSTPAKSNHMDELPAARVTPRSFIDTFVLKQESKKRKRDSLTNGNDSKGSDGMAANNDEVALFGDDGADKSSKKAAKAAKLEARQAKKAAKQARRAEHGQDKDADGDVDDAPFDYTSMPSFLNPPRETKEQARERRKKEKNPYAKAMDAPKGLPRVQKERAGKSMTFKK